MVDSDAGSAEVSPSSAVERPLAARTVRTRQAFARSALFSCAFVIGAGSIWFAAQRAVDMADIKELPLGFTLKQVARDFSHRLAADPARHRVALIGDSTLWPAKGMRSPNAEALPGRVEVALRKYGALTDGVSLHSLRVPGLNPVAVYFVSDEIIAARPDQIVLALNLHAFNGEAKRRFSRTEVAGWLRGRQFVEALRLPLFDTGLTTDRLFFYRGLVTIGAEHTWQQAKQLQARAFKLREIFAERLDALVSSTASADMQAALGLAHWTRLSVDVDGLPRMSRESAQRNLGAVLRGLDASDPTIRVLSALLARFRRARIATLVYIQPMNVEHIRHLGYPLDGVSRSLRTIRRTVQAQGAKLADFHAVLPDRAFRDEGDHYTFAGQPNGTFRLASQIATAVSATLPPVEKPNAVQ